MEESGERQLLTLSYIRKRDSIDGDLMFLFPVIEAILMATAVALTLVPKKQTNLSKGQRSVPPMFLKL